ncbi:MAG: GerMN domain-containing protein, partial [Gudongella sp.]|nr:GerMN domain-containing protein [Gudongella sp.]
MRGWNKIKAMALVLPMVLFMIACTPVTEVPEDVSQEQETIDKASLDDYYPFIHDSTYQYDGYGNEYAEQSIMLEYENGQRAQYRIINPGTEAVKIIERTADSIREIYLEGEFYHTENVIATAAVKNNVLVKEPIQIGNEWELENGNMREITGIDVDFQTPFGSFKTLEVTTHLEQDRIQRDYYAKDVGLVGIVYEDGETTIRSLLSDIVKGPYEKEARLFYPVESENDIGTSYVEYKFDFSTNDHLENIFGDFFKNPVEAGLSRVISEDTMINSIFLDKGTWTVKVDFSSELIPGWNAGSSLEYELIRSIVNTFGEFYDTDEVYISIEGVPFESGHYKASENEAFQVDIEGIE